MVSAKDYTCIHTYMYKQKLNLNSNLKVAQLANAFK